MLKKPFSIGILILGLVLQAFASQLHLNYSLSLRDLVERSGLVVTARCQPSDPQKKNAAETLYTCKVGEVQRGYLDDNKSEIKVWHWEKRAMDAFVLSQKGKIKESLLYDAYRPSTKWEEAMKKPVLLFLSRSGSGSELNFTAYQSFESPKKLGVEKSIIAKIKKSRNPK